MSSIYGGSGAGTGQTSQYGVTGKNKIPPGYKYGQIQQFTPEMMQLFQQMMQHLGPEGFLSKLASGDQSMFEEMEQPALKQFGELQGGLASKFSGMGMGGRRSSGFGNTMNQATSDFASQLQSQRLGLQRQALQDLMSSGNALLQQKPYDTFLTQKQPSFWEQLMLSSAGGLAKGAGQGAMMAMGGG